MTNQTPSVQQALHTLICAYDAGAAPVPQITALIAAVRAEDGHRSLAQGERLIAWRERAEAAEAEHQRLRAEVKELQRQINQWEAEDYDRQQQ